MTEERKKYQDPEWLKEQYWNKGKSAPEIGKEIGMSGAIIRHWMKEHDIPRRTNTEARLLESGTLKERFEEKYTVSDTGCWEWTGSTINTGYGEIWTGEEYRLATHVSLFLETGEWPNKYVLHHCDTPKCVNPNHLYEGTQSDNMEDALQRGRVNLGEDRPGAKLTAKGVKQARLRASKGESVSNIAQDYTVHQRVLRAAITGETWKHLDSEPADLSQK